MSNIFGIISLNGSQPDQAEIDNMIAGVERLGSSQYQTHEETGIFLGFAPNALTPQDYYENQPLTSPDGRFLMLADARFDDRDNLLKKLDYSTEEGERISDGQLGLDAFLKWGRACTDHLIGDFAIMVYDKQKKSLWLVRDHLGIAPLYYAQANGFFAFATLPLPIISLRMIGKQVNLSQVMGYLSGADVQDNYTKYESVYELLPAHQLEVRDGSVRTEKYWEVDMSESDLGSVEDYAEALLEHIERAIDDQMRIQGDISSFISGGLDSSTVSCIIANKLQEKGQRLSTFTYIPQEGYREDRFPGRFVNEQPYVEEIARFVPGIATNFVDLKGSSLFDNLNELLDLSGGLNVHGYYNRLWAEKILGLNAQLGNRAVFEGQAGNITLSTTGLGYYTELAAQGKFFTFLKEIRYHGKENSRPLWRDVLSFGVLPFIPAHLRNWLEAKRNPGGFQIPFLKRDFARKYNPDDYFMLQDKFKLIYDRPIRLRRLQFAKSTAALKRAWEITYGPKLTDPTLDKRLVEFSFKVPLKHFVHQGKFRHLIRTATEGLLPESTRWNYEKGLQLSDEKYLFDQDTDKFNQLLSDWNHHPIIKDFLDLEGMRAFITSPKNSPDALAMRIFFTKMIVCGVFIQRNS